MINLVPLCITVLLAAAALILLDPLERLLAGAILCFICIIAPLWKYWLQQFKVALHGPWDIAHVR